MHHIQSWLRLAIPLEDAVLVFNNVAIFEASFSNCSATISFTSMEALEISELIPLEPKMTTPILVAQALAAPFAKDPFGEGVSCVHTKHRSAVAVSKELGYSAVTTGEDSVRLRWPSLDFPRQLLLLSPRATAVFSIRLVNQETTRLHQSQSNPRLLPNIDAKGFLTVA